MLSFSCTNTDTITGNSGNNLAKPSNIEDTYSSSYWTLDQFLLPLLFIGAVDAYDNCLLAIELFAPYLISDDEDDSHHETDELYNNLYENREIIFEKSYDFRDNYLSNSTNGRKYIEYYRKLSKYSVKNNLINKYYKEHLKITPKAVSLAYNLQHGKKSDELIIDNNISNEVMDLIKIYRNSLNHREIDDILNNIEKDLKKYTNKPKSVIDADFN